ncbi:MAG TPA: hypothetical protein DCM28_03470 [Phycisphaerales bacterium]|nr:hypothetical protein [Phycisphaerales bacterium]|tara:strand:+ start:523 stop:966 length:444 start_codon:yes stop_codon:yes gene_type:complete
MNNPVLIIVMRYVHVLSFIALVGGLLYNMLGQRIARKVLDSEAAETFINAFRGLILKFQWVAILGLIISGTFTWVITNDKYKAIGALGNALIGTKVLLAMMVFCVIWMRWSKLIKSDKTAMMINIHLAAIIILLGATLRYYRLAVGS